MKSTNDNYSTLSSWRRLWDYKLTCGLRGRDFKKLRSLGFDGDKVSFQIVSTSVSKNGDRKVIVPPSWAVNTTIIGQLLQKHFPKLHNDNIQRQRAGRWARIICLYFRMGFPDSYIALEIGQPLESIKNMIVRIRYAAEHLDAPIKRRGRPRKVVPL